MLLSIDSLSSEAPDPRALIRSDLACILSHALDEREAGRGTLPDLLGLLPAQLADLSETWFPGLILPDLDAPDPARLPDQDAIALLLLWRGGHATPESHWFAAIIGRRAMETRHLWEDLGLPSRRALGHLIDRHFPRIHAANTQNMRWKKFFYRQICSDQDFALCLSPTCDDCAERADCFAPD
ncbi:nitrogen fixation protein NifQ [Tropicimonas isoalkanivorans]|uniref:Nitrogen fixation protein NifQ n=1 Tax=Tropicimonas isoalkanivorans TaxID=441112 RepID=A0A1I1H5V6_9RHOB|nr:nitrogen fixation protein NifQ [Tropicimonas isoalkanivorans]SFC19387.1 nitrogen fixation protein NifQ [Tropicimonas isoalkanivorans]